MCVLPDVSQIASGNLSHASLNSALTEEEDFYYLVRLKMHWWRSTVKWKQFGAALVGVIVATIGLLWFLQGAAVVRMCPVLCFTDCECVLGGSLFWEAVGAIVAIIGIGIVTVSARLPRRRFRP